MQSMYGKGGSTHPMHLKKMAEALRSKGQRHDSVLAHINPEEAEYLEHHFGGDTNPHTGLPQYGKHRKFGFFGPSRHSNGEARTESIFQQGRRHHPVLGALADVAVAGLGTALGGPAGGLAASAFKGGLDQGIKGVPGGVMKGLAYNAIAPSVGDFFGIDPNSFMGSVTGLQHPSLLHQFGMSSAPSHGGGLGLFGNMGTQGLFNAGNGLMGSIPKIEHGVENIVNHENKGWIGKMLGKASDSIMSNPLDAALMAMTIGGTLGAKSKTPPEEKTMQQVAQETRPVFSPRDERKPKPMQRKRVAHSPEVWQRYLNEDIAPPMFFEDVNPPTEYYAHGGHATNTSHGHYFDGHSGGQTDDRPTKLPEGAYVMDATTVSLAGDGNSRNGALKIKRELEGPFMRDKHAHHYAMMHRGGKEIDAMLSDGEQVIPPYVVTAIGKGNNNKGAKELDVFRKNLRAQKGVKKFLPPKSKKLMSYMR